MGDGKIYISVLENPEYLQYITPEETRKYAYLKVTEGVESANEYLKYLEPQLTARKGAETGRNVVDGGALLQIPYRAFAGLESYGRNIGQLMTEEAVPLSATAYANQYVRENTDGVGRFAGDLSYGLGNVAPSVAAGMLNPWLGKASFAASAYGGAYNNALLEGRETKDARTYATLSTASELAMQHVLGGISALGGKTSLVNLSENLINKIGNVNLRLTAQLGNRMLGEGAEEGLQTYMEAALRNVLFDEDYNLRDVSEEALYNSMLGAVTAFVTESPTVFSEYTYSNLNNQGDWEFLEQAFLSEAAIAEQERMSSSSEYAIKLGLTSSGDFTKRFNLMTDDVPLRREFYHECKNMLHRRSGNNGEDLLYYNPRLKKWYRSTTGTKARKPEYSDEILLGLKENKSNELIAFHNHPHGMPPSIADLNTAMQNGYKRGYTIGHNGVIFEYTPPRERIPVSSYDTLISKYSNLGYSEFDAQCAALDYLKELYGFTYKEVR